VRPSSTGEYSQSVAHKNRRSNQSCHVDETAKFTLFAVDDG
jgi:hypothetical protein